MTPRTNDSTDLASMAGSSLGVLLGSGLSGVSDRATADAVLPFEKIPGSPTSAGVAGHDGELRRCRVAGSSCLFICGRKHFYEGDAGDIVRLIEFVHELGVRRLVVTSAAGTLVKTIYPGELVLVDDILDFQFQPPLGAAVGAQARLESQRAGRPGEKGRLSLDLAMRRQLRSAATRAGVAFGRGSVVTCAGPVYETASEIRALQQTGSSLVTMSGAPEVKAANSLGVRVAMIALVTNWAAGISTVKLRHDDVLAAAENAIPKLTRLIAQFIDNK